MREQDGGLVAVRQYVDRVVRCPVLRTSQHSNRHRRIQAFWDETKTLDRIADSATNGPHDSDSQIAQQRSKLGSFVLLRDSEEGFIV
jgi:hypothetical protein